MYARIFHNDELVALVDEETKSSLGLDERNRDYRKYLEFEKIAENKASIKRLDLIENVGWVDRIKDESEDRIPDIPKLIPEEEER